MAKDDAKLFAHVIGICIEHCMDPDALVRLLNERFHSSITAPEQAFSAELESFLMTAYRWQTPPPTEEIERRRAEVRRAWAQTEIGILTLPGTRSN